MANIEKFFKDKKNDNIRIYESKQTPEQNQSVNTKINNLNNSGKSHKFKSWKAIAGAIAVLLFFGSFGSAGYFYWQYKKALKNPSAASADETKEITEKIGQIMDLPDEQPSLATVTDKEKLKDNVFFNKAQNGDKVLIYSQTGKAILFRPSAGRIIEVSSLSQSSPAKTVETPSPENKPEDITQNQITPASQNENQDTEPEDQPETKAETVKITIYNGTNIKGLAKTIAGEISAIEGVEIGEKTNAKGNYTANLVVDLTGTNKDATQKIADKIGGTVGELPAEESKPESADILVIGGKAVR